MKMKKMLAFALSVTMAIISSVSINASATSYVLNSDNVDSGGHLDWDYDTTYYVITVWGMNLWNGYKAGVIREDTPSIIQDLFVTDINDPSEGYYGYNDQSNAKIYFNICYMETLAHAQKMTVAAHELGHALGLAHNPYVSNAVMADGSINSFPLSLHQDDKDSYDAAALLY